MGARTGTSTPLTSRQKGSLDAVYNDIFLLRNSMRRGVTNLDNSQVKRRIVRYPKNHFKGRDRFPARASCPFLALSMLVKDGKKSFAKPQWKTLCTISHLK